jgi:hypothetical protein
MGYLSASFVTEVYVEELGKNDRGGEERLTRIHDLYHLLLYSGLYLDPSFGLGISRSSKSWLIISSLQVGRVE